jgi:DNA/RNA endonuclease YhcR with UshA esterase domain
MQLIKALIVVLALSGTVAFVVASRATPRNVTAISAISPAMNFAYVQVHGKVPAYPSLDSANQGFLSFRVQDETGSEIRISAYREVVSALIAAQRVPMPGDMVTVEGTLRVRDDEASLVLNTADGLSLNTPQAQVLELSALDATALGERVTVSGQVRRIREISAGLKIISLRQGSGVADVLLPVDMTHFGPAPALMLGSWMSVTGTVGEFRGERQVLPRHAHDLVALPNAQPIETRPIDALNKNLLGQWVAVRGLVADLRPFKQGMRIELQDVSGARIVIVAFDSAWNATPFSQTLTINDSLQVQGELAEYRGEFEILPEMGADLELVE